MSKYQKMSCSLIGFLTAAAFSTEVSFQGDGYLELSNSLLPHKSAEEREEISIEFSTTEPNGLIFWHGQTPDTDGKTQDYVALAVVDGVLEYSYELGSGPAQIRPNVRVDDGKRHHVVLKREASDGTIKIDNTMEFGESQGILKMLNTRGNIYIGECRPLWSRGNVLASRSKVRRLKSD